MKNIERLAIESVIYDNVSVQKGRDEMLVALRKEGEELATLRDNQKLLVEALGFIADKKNWITINGEILWNDFYGNEFFTQHAQEIAESILAKIKESEK